MPNHIPRLDAAHVLTEEAIRHVLDGDGAPNYRGGHRFTSLVVGKTVFPEDWSDDDIVAAIVSTIEHPAKVSRRRQRIIYLGLVNQVIIEVKIDLTRYGYVLRHAFPKNGQGVFRNEPSQRIPLPLDLSILEA